MIDRTAVHKFKIGEAPSDFAYWQTRPFEERLAAAEAIRAEYHGWKDENQPRLERVVRVIKRP